MVASNGLLIQYVCDDIKDDKGVILSDVLKGSKEFVLDVIQQNGNVLEYMSESLNVI